MRSGDAGGLPAQPQGERPRADGLLRRDDVVCSRVQPPGPTGSPGDPESKAEAFGASPELGSPSKGAFRLKSRVVCLIRMDRDWKIMGFLLDKVTLNLIL